MDGLVGSELPVRRRHAEAEHSLKQVTFGGPFYPGASERARSPGSLSWACPLSSQLP